MSKWTSLARQKILETPSRPAAVAAERNPTAALAAPNPGKYGISPDDEARVRAWLEFIGEHDPEMINGCLAQCVADLDALAYFLRRAREVPEAPQLTSWVTCAACTHFERTDHPHLGRCDAGQLEAAAGLWDTDRRVCGSFQVKP